MRGQRESYGKDSSYGKKARGKKKKDSDSDSDSDSDEEESARPGRAASAVRLPTGARLRQSIHAHPPPPIVRRRRKPLAFVAISAVVTALVLTVVYTWSSASTECPPGTREDLSGLGCVLNAPFPAAVDASIIDARQRPCGGFAGFACGAWSGGASRRTVAAAEYAATARAIVAAETAEAWAWLYDACVAAYAGDDGAYAVALKKLVEDVIDADDRDVDSVLAANGIDTGRCREAGQDRMRPSFQSDARCASRRWRNATEEVMTEMRSVCGSKCRSRLDSLSEAKKNALWCAAWFVSPYLPRVTGLSAADGCAGWTTADVRAPRAPARDARQLPTLSRAVGVEKPAWARVCEEAVAWHAPAAVHRWLYDKAAGVPAAKTIAAAVAAELADIARDAGLASVHACLKDLNIVVLGEDVPAVAADSYIGAALGLLNASRNSTAGPPGSASPASALVYAACATTLLSPRLLHPPFFSAAYDAASAYAVFGGAVAEGLAAVFPPQDECEDAATYLALTAAYKAAVKSDPAIKDDTEATRRFFEAYMQLRCGDEPAPLDAAMRAVQHDDDKPFMRAFGCKGKTCVPSWD